MLGLRKADQASMGMLFVSLFGVFGADLSRVQSEGSRLLFMVHDALLFIQQKYLCCGDERSPVLGRILVFGRSHLHRVHGSEFGKSPETF